eukprot:m.720409 g.720409  ORF g.720409 m.720409 type:complete len:924 (-) comp23004_c1_seq1:188-2959(-)
MSSASASTALPKSSAGNRAIFEPYRALGLICNHVRSVVQTRGNDHFVTTCVGDAYHVYNCAKLNLVAVGLAHDQIDTIAVQKHDTIVACGPDVSVWRRGKRIGDLPGHDAGVHTILAFGNIICTVTDSNILRVFDLNTRDLYLTLEDLNGEYFQISTLVHPSTYLNKVLLGSRQGRLQLWNINSKKMIYEFPGWKSPVTYLEQSTVVDVVAIGLEDGHIIIHNIKQDKTVMKFFQDGGPVTGISFRTDGHPIMASGNTAGTIAFWNLEEKNIDSVVHDAHNGAVSTLTFLTSQAQLVSTGARNSMKIWTFDQTDNGARVLRSREGHSAPPSKIRYYGDDGRNILSASQDRSLRCFNVFSDARSHELSQGSVVKRSKKLGIRAEQIKCSAVVDFAAEEVREREWDNIVSVHMSGTRARTWRLEHKRLGTNRLTLPENVVSTMAAVSAKCVATSACGNFAIVGYGSGHAAKFNMQSGQFRCLMGTRAHAKAVRGIACDALNRHVITVSLDRHVKLWLMATGKLVWKVDLPAPLVLCELHRESALLATAGDDFTLRVVDVEGAKVVRVFSGHENRVTDMAWSADAHWLLSSAMDLTIRVWDVPTSCCISRISVPTAVISLTLSPTLDFLATSHVGSVGVYLWANRSLYSEVSIKPETATSADTSADDTGTVASLPRTRIVNADEPSTTGVTSATAAFHHVDEDATHEEPTTQEDYEHTGHITLSALPTARWATLSDLAAIKQRNKPIEPPKAPRAAPFFLTATQHESGSGGSTDLFGNGGLPGSDATNSTSHVLNFGKLGTLSPFQQRLTRAAETGNYMEFMDYMKSLAPSTIDLEMRSLSLLDDCVQLRRFLEFLRAMLERKQDFEVTQSYLHLFLKVHGDTCGAMPHLSDDIQATLDQQEECWLRLEGLFQHSLCAVNFFKGTV